MRKFKVGVRVKLVSKRWGDGIADPVWGGSQGEVGGTIMDIDFDEPDNRLQVEWDNDCCNSYNHKHLKVLNLLNFKIVKR